MKKEFLIFEKGKYPQGDFSNIDVLNECVTRFNSTKLRIGVFIGHKYSWQMQTEADELSHGEILELRINQKGQIFAVDYDFDDSIVEKVAKRQLLFCSPEFIGDPQKKLDIVGLAFLGRTPPANPFALLPQFFGLKPEDNKNIPNNFIGSFKFEREFSSSFSQNNNKGDETPMTEEEKKAFSDMQSAIVNLTKQNADLQNVVSQFAKQETDLKTKQIETEAKEFFEKKVQDGFLPPAQKDEAIKVFSKLPDEEARASFKKLFDNKVIEPNSHFAKKEGKDDGAGGTDLYSQIKAFQAENKLSSFEEASKLLFSKKPELFKEAD